MKMFDRQHPVAADVMRRRPHVRAVRPFTTAATDGSADLKSAVSQNCILRTVANAKASDKSNAQPIANRRYSRFQICATIFALLALSFMGLSASAQSLTASNLASIAFEQKLNSQVSLDLNFRDEHGREVRLGEYFHRQPVVLVLGYYQCPMLCTLTLNGLVQGLEEIKWTVGREFEIINVSIDPRETPDLALGKKQSCIARYGRPGAVDGWHFLTGDGPALQQLAGEVGFQYAYDPVAKQYAHPSGLVILTPDGKVSRYLFGVTYDARELVGSLRDASAGQVGSPLQQFVLLCFHYSPITGRYGALILFAVRLLGAITLLLLAGYIARAVRRDLRRPSTLALVSSPAELSSGTDPAP